MKERGLVLSNFGWNDSQRKGAAVQGIIGPVLADGTGKFDLSPYQLPVNPLSLGDVVYTGPNGFNPATTKDPRLLLAKVTVRGTPFTQFIYNATNIPNNFQTYIELDPGEPTFNPQGPVLILRYTTTGGIVFDSHPLGMQLFTCQSAPVFTSWVEDISYFDRIEGAFLEWSAALWIPC
jgi:hypothetical protein